MEERVTPPPAQPPHPLQNNTTNPTFKLPDIAPGTYVVQVPKDQVYRVPPPQNASIAEQHRKTPKKEGSGTRCCCLAFLIVIVIIVVVVAFLGSLFSIILSPHDPKFSINRFQVQTKPHKQYDVALQSNNPNSNVGIEFKEGGRVSLSLKKQNNKNIGSGAYPGFYQPQENSTVIGVSLKSATSDFPKEVRDSMLVKGKGKARVAFSLAVRVEAKMKMWFLRSGDMKYDVVCQVTVDGLDKSAAARVVSQECRTKRH